MKKFVAASLVFVLTLFLGMVGSALAGNNGIGWLASDTVYRVNIIAYENCPQSNNAQRIAVLANYSDDPTGETLITLDKTNKIFLMPGDDFRVLESNACDGDGAVLQLPDAPDLTALYSVWVRLVGPPDSGIDVNTCAVDPGTGTIVCGDDHLVRVRYTGKGEPKFTNATNDLLKLNGTPLFDSMYTDYFWNWGTQGRPHAQVWFVDENGG